MAEKEPGLDAAYALQTPEDNRHLYAGWASTYDSDFATGMDYRLPQVVARIAAEGVQAPGPILDVGAGTGLVAEHLAAQGRYVIDALDISPQMLAVAAKKGHYRRLIEADLTGRIDIADAVYGAVVSAGTFTHGHVGPDALAELLRIARPGAVFVISINAAHFRSRGFDAAFDALGGAIGPPDFRDVAIYGDGAEGAHKRDLARIAVFRKS